MWIACHLFLRHAATAYLLGRPYPNFFAADPVNVRLTHSSPVSHSLTQSPKLALFFTGDVLLKDQPGQDAHHQSSKLIWGLYCRTGLIWMTCLRMRLGLIPTLRLSPSMSPQEREEYHERRAAFAHHIWLETLYIEKALEAHTCAVDASFFYNARLKLFKLSVFFCAVCEMVLMVSVVFGC